MQSLLVESEDIVGLVTVISSIYLVGGGAAKKYEQGSIINNPV
jgi:hypothetical protein